jgi:chromate reductase, NAD(P)H dehydrogenase (quinone)
MPDTLNVLAFAGSLRAASYNLALLRAAGARAPAGMRLTIFDLAPIPLFNADLEAIGIPAAVIAFKEAIAAADALLIATPEYNHGVPGVLKNALDWASRPAGKSPLWEKPVGVIGASPGQVGTARAQSQIRQTFEFTNCLCMNQPELLVFRAHERFDADGNLVDENATRFLDAYLIAFLTWSRRSRAASFEPAPMQRAG